MSRAQYELCFGLCVALSLAASSSSVESARATEASDNPANWPTHGRTYDEQRFSPLSSITAENVRTLGLAWYYDLDTNRGQEATPLVVDGVLYSTTAWSKVVALDAATGKLLWKHDPKVPGRAGVKGCCDVVNRGAAYDDGKIFFGTFDGRLQALNAKTGQLLWSVDTVDQTRPYTITGAPRVVHGKVIIGNGGADLGVRGYVSAYDSQTGKLVWRFYTVPGDPKKPDHAASDASLGAIARPTWFGTEYIKTGGGGTAWDSLVYDADLNQLYIGVGNGSPLVRKFRSLDKGDNLFLSSIVALNPDTGKYLWHYQEVPGETWDFTASQQITLVTLRVEGRPVKAILHAPKNGFFYVIDRKTGKLISADKYAAANWADRVDLKTGRPVEIAGARYLEKPFLASVGGAGAHSWQPMSYSPETHLVYIPVQQVGAYYNLESGYAFQEGHLNLGYDMMTMRLPTAAADRAAMIQGLDGWLLAWDPVTKKEVWRANHGVPWNGGTLATAGNLVFQGTAKRTFEAYDAKNGHRLWAAETQEAVMGGPISYSVNGQQYVAVLTGNGGALPLALPTFGGPHPEPNGRVLAFKLNAAVQLPPFSPSLAPLNVVNDTFADDQVEKGRVLYGHNCGTCHGLGAWASGVIPDLRRSEALSDQALWQSIVIKGALEQNGMVSFAKDITSEDAELIRSFVASEAQHLAEAQPSKQ